MLQRRCPAGTWETARELPGVALRPGVLEYRGFSMALGRPRRRLEVPTTLVTVLFNFGQPMRVSRPSDGLVLADTDGPFVAGLLTHSTVGEHGGDARGVEVSMQPWAAYRLFGVPLHELAGALTPLDSVARPADRALTDALAGARGWQARFDLLDAALEIAYAGGPVPSPRVIWAWNRLRQSHGALAVRTLVDETGWGERQLERRFREQIGLPPRTAARLLRVQHALRLLTDGGAPAAVAVDSGFYDQAHFGRDFKAITGCTPSQFMAARHTPPVGPPVLDRVSGQITSAALPHGRGPARTRGAQIVLRSPRRTSVGNSS
ncbi:helix-turn-helix domain-containing protein [Streptomyces sp. NBC_01304]|uniref:helix-turn-helix domain-containing protein n=1 Tax=Streptomyces sp. NBC_01304 TaxID=2903818 RepID=UPI002E108BD9|nr:helix-turn-helix domain-containing protein [Streptomyces sp. NBC_01304]